MPKRTRRNKKRANPRKSRKQKGGALLSELVTEKVYKLNGRILGNYLRSEFSFKYEDIKSLDNVEVATDEEQKIMDSTEPIKTVKYSNEILKVKKFEHDYFLKKNVKLFLLNGEEVTGLVHRIEFVSKNNRNISVIVLRDADDDVKTDTDSFRYRFVDKLVDSGFASEDDYKSYLSKCFHSLEFL